MAGSSLLPVVFTSILEDAVERFLRLDPRCAEYLAPVAGKAIGFRLTPLDVSFFLCPTETSVQIMARIDSEPDATLSGSPLAFARLGLSGSHRRALFAGDVRVEGDTDVTRRFEALFERFEIDWARLLAPYAGKAVADNLVGVLRAVQLWGEDSNRTLRLNMAEFIQEEARVQPAPAEADGFNQDVDALRADADRLQARFERLRARLDTSIDDNEPR